ncbi:hypothetical protein Vadar_029442 [Vaccinium darrowii]|uniref:Uncharacterized protein n=1 Tax=Vaccinium darrowii TaxID=229202 RepID=A0ACB7YR21_9ERIC|nr:hypothetical protein Vadar_029442 [Vaccinium darrowii]
MCTPQCIFEKLGGLAFDEAIKAGKYVVRYAKNLKNMQIEMRDLDDRREDIESKVREAHDRGEEIKVDVLHWQTDVDKLKNDVDRLVRQSTDRENMRCITCSCPNIMTRYKLSKLAEENIVAANNLIKKSNFEEISRPRPRPPELESLADNNYVNYDSRASIYKDLMDALKVSNVNMIGVYGLGGVGKTTLVKEVGDQMRQDGTFKQVAIAAVSKDFNVKEVQSKLVESLNLKLKATTDDQEGRRTELWNKLKNGDKYLVILDDIWEMVDLKKIGIPISDGKIGCKVVLTSRKEDLLRITMKADRNFRIAELPEEEAWDLFKKKVGNSIESQPEIYPLACELCKKCNGLPLAINALGTALQDKPDYTWKNASDKLKKYMLTQIEGIDRGVIATLRVSYDMLQSSDAQSCFLLCCLFAEDAEIPIDDLTRHCVARRLLAQNPHTLDEARNAVCTVVDVLKSASLLTTGSHENVVKIHDVIRDVGISISRDEKAFLIDHGALRWPENPKNGPSYSTISLNFKNIKRLPGGLVYPQLYTLMVDSSELSDLEVPDNFFNGMTQLTVLSFTKMRMRRLPSSLAKLKYLRMLNLNGCELEDIAILKDMKSNLEVLSLRGSSIKALPPEIAQLTSLRLLDLRDCSSLIEIPQGIISNLTNLEELLFPDNFNQWEAAIDKKKEVTNSNSKNMGLEELRQSLDNGQLTTLHIFIPNVMLLPKDGLKFENLKKFRILVGSNFDWFENFKWYEKFPGTRVLEHKGSSLRNEFIPLVYKAEALSLNGIKGLKEVFHDRGAANGFPNLKYLEVKSCDDDLKYFLGEPKSSVQSHGLHPLPSFNKLTRLTIEKCKLRYLFSPAAAGGLVNLEQLEVWSCEIMEAIVGFEGQNDENELTGDVMFSKLKKLLLRDLPNLTSFYAEKEKTQTTTESSSGHPQPLFNNKVILPVLEELKVESLDSIEEIWDKQSPSVNQETVFFGQLRTMIVRQCKKLMNLVPSNILPRLQNLQDLRVASCPNVKFVVFKNGNEEEAANDSTLIIPRLTHLEIRNMEKLKSFYSSSTTSSAQSLFNHQVILPVLEELKVESLDSIEEIWDKQSPSVNQETVFFGQLRTMIVRQCKKLMNLVPSNILPRLQNLQDLRVASCPNVKFVVFKNGNEEEAANDSTLIIPRLTHLEIRNMEKLKSFYSSSTTSSAQSLFNHQVILPVLEELQVEELDSIEEIWDKQSPSVNEKTTSFSQLTDVTVKKCEKLMNLGPWNILSRLRNLQRLTVDGCPNVEFIVLFKNGKGEEEVADDSTLIIPLLRHLRIEKMEKLKSFYSSSTTANAQSFFNHQVILPSLEVLEVQALDSIKEIWDKQSTSVIKKTASFSQLRDMTVKECKELVNLVPANILPRLRNLQSLTVDGCPNVEVIVLFKNGKEEEVADESTFIIPQLRYLAIRNMEKLKSFCSSSTTSNAQSLFNHQVILPVLEELEVEELDSIEEIWDKQSPSVNQETASFGQLKKMTVRWCMKMMNLGPWNILSRLRNLQRLTVDGCPNVEFIVLFKNGKGEEEAADERTLIIPQLRYLAIQNMEKLKSFCSSSTTSNAQSLFNHQVILPSLKVLEVQALDSIKEIWDKQSTSVIKKTASFSQLRDMTVKKCKELVNLGPANILPRLRNLQHLIVDSCPNVEVIVLFKNGKEEEAADESTFIIPQLRYLAIQNMAKLKSFCSSSTTSNAQSLFNHQVIFPVLETLHIEEVGNVIEIWDKQSIGLFEAQESFCQLMNLQVRHCNKLIHLFPSKMHLLLKNLKTLHVTRCETMEGVVGFEEELDDRLGKDQLCFSKLTSLYLIGLPKLVSFYIKMGEAGTIEGNPTIHAQPLFNGKVILPVLENLEVESLDSIEEIWDKQSPSVNQETASFGQLRNIEVKGCTKLMNLVPSNILPRLRNLRTLKVNDCPNVEFIVFKKKKGEEEAVDDSTLIIPQLSYLGISGMEKLKGFYSSSTTSNAQSLFNHQVAFPALEYISIWKVPMITGIWVQQPENGVESFCKLKSITVWNCDQLEYVLPSYMLPQLHNLLQLKVIGCKELEVIVSNKLKEKEATNNDILVFPQLKTLELQELNNLKCFCTGTDQLLLSHKVILPVLEELKVEALNSIEEIWDKQSPSVNQETESFGQLRNIEVKGCKKLMNLVPSNILPRLRNLQFLAVEDCPNVEFVVFKNKKGEEEAVDDSNLIIPQLRGLRIWKMEKLKSFYSSSTTSNAQSLFNHQVAFPVLGYLTIRGLLEVKEIWDKQPVPEPENKAKSFYKLMSIHVEDCNQLVHVFPSYMLPQLQNLQKLVIANCKEMEVIISNKPEEKEATNNHIILFAELKTVVLQILPNLKRLYSEVHDAVDKSTTVSILAFASNKYKQGFHPYPKPGSMSDPKVVGSGASLLSGIVFLILRLIGDPQCQSSQATSTVLLPMTRNAFPMLEINAIEIAIKDLSRRRPLDPPRTSSIDPDLIFLVNGTSRKEVVTEESGTSSKVEDNNDHNKEEEEDSEEDVKNADNNEGGRGGGREEKDDEGGGGD